jgi:hypothetical protein
MQRIKLSLALLVLTASQYSYAQSVDLQPPPSGQVTTALVNHASETNQYESFGTKITVFSLIVGVYMLYGYKEKV